jgi:hypothetical protein
MKKEYICYCGLYCENCAIKAKVGPAAEALYKEMCKAGYESFIDYLPSGTEFWKFLKYTAQNGTCNSCKDGGGDPGCKIRICAREKKVEMCPLCSEYPCAKITDFFGTHSEVYGDNLLLKEKGMDAWAKMQDERRSKGITFQDLR